jgi:peptidoglycan/LPS O-acetylase OafA/YrhL
VFVIMTFGWFVKHTESGPSSTTWMLLLVPLCVFCGIATYFLIERPMMRFLQTRFSPKRPVLPEVSAGQFDFRRLQIKASVSGVALCARNAVDKIPR